MFLLVLFIWSNTFGLENRLAVCRKLCKSYLSFCCSSAAVKRVQESFFWWIMLPEILEHRVIMGTFPWHFLEGQQTIKSFLS